MRSLFYRDSDPDPGRTVMVCGSGRSGTTWLAELINRSNGFRYMFEPFWHRTVPECRAFNIRQYLRPDETDPAYCDAARAIVTGRIRRWWIDKYNRRFDCQRRLIKDIRANLFLGWLRARFPETRIVFLLRHPGAVTLSRMGRKWRARVEEVVGQPHLVEDHLRPCLERVGEPRDRFDRHVFMWCIENLVPLRQLEPGSVHLIYYEDLCVDPEAELRRLCDAIDLEFDPAILDRVRRPSRQAQPRSAVHHKQDLVGGWRDKLTTTQIDRLHEIVGGFGLDAVYSPDPMPVAADPLGLFGA